MVASATTPQAQAILEEMSVKVAATVIDALTKKFPTSAPDQVVVVTRGGLIVNTTFAQLINDLTMATAALAQSQQQALRVMQEHMQTMNNLSEVLEEELEVARELARKRRR